MFSPSLVVLFALFSDGVVDARAGRNRADRNVYKRANAAEGDVRSPCPALNALANHGYLPRNGKSITADQLTTSIEQVYNIDATFGYLLGHTAVPMVENNSLIATSLDLDHLNLHDAIEHDASLTRNDFSQGDNHSLQPTLLDALLSDAQGDFLTVESLAKTRARREKESQVKGSPKLTTKGSTLAYGESALLLQAFGAPSTDPNGTPKAPKAQVQTWFRDEKLDGYVKPAKAISLTTTSTLSSAIQSMAKQMSSSAPSTPIRFEPDSYIGKLVEWLGY